MRVVAMLLIAGLAPMMAHAQDADTLGLTARVDGGHLVVELEAHSEVQLVATWTDESGPMVAQVVAAGLSGSATVEIPLARLGLAAETDLMLFSLETPLPILDGVTDLIDAERLNDLAPLAKTSVPLPPAASGLRIVEPLHVTDEWVAETKPLVTRSGAVVVGYYGLDSEPNEMGGLTEVRTSLFAKVSWDGGRTFGDPLIVGPTGEPRGHWNFIETSPDVVRFVIDSSLPDAFFEIRDLDVQAGTLGEPIFVDVGDKGPYGMSLTPGLAATDDTTLIAASVRPEGQPKVTRVWELAPDGSLALRTEFANARSMMLAAHDGAVAAVWLDWTNSDQNPAFHFSRMLSDGTFGPAHPIGPLNDLLVPHPEVGVWGPTTTSLSSDGTIHLTVGFHAPNEPGENWDSYVYYVRILSTGTVLLTNLAGSPDWGDPKLPMIHHQVVVANDRAWLLFSRGWSGETFVRRSLDLGTTFGPTTELVTPAGQLFYAAGQAMTDRPMAILPDGRPLVATLWYIPGPEPRNEAFVVFPLHDPFAEAVLHGARPLMPHLEPSPVRTEDSARGLALAAGAPYVKYAASADNLQEDVDKEDGSATAAEVPNQNTSEGLTETSHVEPIADDHAYAAEERSEPRDLDPEDALPWAAGALGVAILAAAVWALMARRR